MKPCLLVSVALLAISGMSGCGGSSGKPIPGMGCAINSDCAAGLICAFGLCHGACVVNGDCPTSQLCVKTAEGADGGSANVCQLPKEATCLYNSNCMLPLVCARDEMCRNQCLTDVDCVSPQVCTPSHVCALSSQLMGGDVPLVTTGRGDASADAYGAEGTLGAGGNSGAAGSSGRDGGGDGGPPPSCAAGLTGFHPSNLPAGFTVPSGLPTVVQAVSNTFDTDTLAFTAPLADGGQPTAMTVTLSDGRTAALLVFQSYSLASGITLSVTGELPLIIAANGNVQIDGTISAITNTTTHWYCGGAPGPATAARGGICGLNDCQGGGAAGETTSAQQIGSGGGAFCGKGGSGAVPLVDGGTMATPPPGGTPYGVPELVPLVGGASSGSTDSTVNLTNHGGGAVELVAGGTLTITENGIINMGGGADLSAFAVGGGAGGGILLEAPTVNVKGALVANGASGAAYHGTGQDGQVSLSAAMGGGTIGGAGSSATSINGGNGQWVATNNWSGGGGGAGRIRINTGCGGALNVNSSALISPGSTTSCYTTGSLR